MNAMKSIVIGMLCLAGAAEAAELRLADFGARGIVFEDNVFRGATRDVYVGPHCEMPRMSGNVGLGKVVRDIGDLHSGGGLSEDQWKLKVKKGTDR